MGAAAAPRAPRLPCLRKSWTMYFTHEQLSGGMSSSCKRMITSPLAIEASRLYP